MGKKIRLSLYYIILMLICPALIGVGEVQADTSNFYFSDFTADYYLSKDEDGVSHLRVVENLTAEFPKYAQNKGICRQIPYTNQAEKNTVLAKLDSGDITVLRNGAAEPIYSIEKYNGHYEVCTGTDEYVMGTQVYTLEYEFDRVVMDFGDYQELYWDTNGNGWSQPFWNLTARVHFEGTEDDFTGESWCYVGSYGEKGQGRCVITEIKDGVEFGLSSDDDIIARGENLTFDVKLKSGAFVVPEPENDYTLIWIMSALVVVCGLGVALALKKYLGSREKEKYYKSRFVKPEYQPDKSYSVAEMAEIYIGTKKDAKVAVLLDMIVKGNISMVKKESKIFGGKVWEIIVNDAENLRKEELIVLTILNGGAEPETGSRIGIRVRTADARLVRLGNKYDSTILDDLRKDKLVESGYQIGEKNRAKTTTASLLTFIVMWPLLAMVLMVMAEGFDDVFEAMGLGMGKILVGQEAFWPVVIGVILLTMILRHCLKKKTEKYVYHTLAGLDASRYMDGLKLYIRMAEAERMKLLQSVKGADVSPEGIVKLYEKLLPYAAVFGLEESWMKEMAQYCKIQEIEEPVYLRSGFDVMAMASSVRGAAAIARSSSHYSYSGSSISGGGGFSSGSSGGGGGGFSGGGGGGGGGGGR